MLADSLTRRLRDRFPDVKMVFGTPPGPVAVIPAMHPEVGDIQIFEDGPDVILVAGKFTHTHISDFNAGSEEEAEQQTADNVVSFLDRMFADQIVLWGSHKSGGGWYDRKRADTATAEHQRLTDGKRLYVWSGPLDR